jgi:alpha-ketoglutarate-dependent taurine dioxygenase
MGGGNPRIFDKDLTGPSAWTAADLSDDDWRVPVPDACLAELDGAIAALRKNPLPTVLLDPTDFALDACRKLTRRVRDILENGVGFAVLDRLRLSGLSDDESKTLYWLLSNMVSRVVAGAWDGRMLHDVVDTRQKLGLRVRGDLTNQEIQWHTDNGFSCTPDHIGLLCIRAAPEGGANRIASLHAAHDLMRDRHPDLLARLYEPFYWNRMGEHHPDDTPVNRFPYFEHDGTRLRGRFNRRIVHAGYELAGEPFDEAGRAAVAAFCEVLDDPALSAGFTLEAGQVAYMNNRVVAHHRTAFVDADAPDMRRHLVRIYMRDQGPRSYLGDEGLARPPAAA